MLVAHDKIKPKMVIEYKPKQFGVVTKVQKYRFDTYVNVLDDNGDVDGNTLRNKVTRIRLTKDFKALYESYLKYGALKNVGKIHCSSGSDPEIFVVDENNQVIPAFNFLGSKEQPTMIDTDDKNFNGRGSVTHGTKLPMFWDGFQAEFNTRADNCLAWVIDSMFVGLKTLHKEAKKFNPKARVTIQPTLDIPFKMLQDAKPEHVAFGCMPSFNAYGMSGHKVEGRDVPFRSTGGHLHFGIAGLSKDIKTIEKYVKALDKVLAVACVSLFAKYDDPKRRSLYGLAGEYRTPPHGMEYRTLSNLWLCHPLITNVVFDLARHTMNASDKDFLGGWKATEKETIKCINECDVTLSRKILKRNEMVFKALLFSISYDANKVKVLYNMFMLGVESMIDNPDDVAGNWGLDGKFSGHCEGEGMNIAHIEQQKNYAKLLGVKLD